MGIAKPEKQEVADAIMQWLKATYKLSKEDNHATITYAQRLAWKELKNIPHKRPAEKKAKEE